MADLNLSPEIIANNSKILDDFEVIINIIDNSKINFTKPLVNKNLSHSLDWGR